jgi:putative membrane protein
MKTLNLFGLLVIGVCTFQSCKSPENRGGNADSSTVDSAGADTSGMSMSPSAKDSMPADVTNQSGVDTEEATFMKKAAIGGMMEVDLGKIAQKSANADVKAFATQMVTDHTKANTELKALAANKGIVLPAEYPAEEKAHIDMMKSMTGAAFDKHYIEMMVTDHDKTVALFKSAEASADKGVSDFVKKTLPVITAHFEKAKTIQAKLK